MPKKIIKPTTMRIPPDVLRRLDKAAKAANRSRTKMMLEYVERGLREDKY